MASILTPPKGGSPKQLAELLEAQQEPFVLEVYLLERGCRRKNSYSEGSFGCFFSDHSSKIKCSRGSTRSFSSSRRRKRSTDVAKKCSEIRKGLLNKLVSIKNVVRLKGCDIGEAEFNDTTQGRRKKKEVVPMEESERLSSASFSTEFNSCSEGDLEDTSMDGNRTHRQLKHQTYELATDTMTEWRAVEENKQSSPDSVLDEIEPSPTYNVGCNKQEEGPSTSIFNFPKRPTEESIFSASLWSLLIRKRREKKGCKAASNDTCSRYTGSKKALQQTRQLLFDCVREAVESQGRKQRKTEHLMGSEELGKIICDNMRVWCRKSSKEKKIMRLVRSDLLGSCEEWDDFAGFGGEIVNEVGDQILEEIKDEMMKDLLASCISKSARPRSLSVEDADTFVLRKRSH